MFSSARILSAVLFGSLSVSVGASGLFGDTEEFDEFEVFIEINATDGDAGLQGKLDGGPWERARVMDSEGDTIFLLRPQANLASHGASEIQWESNEPPFGEFPLEDFLALFPVGEYVARGVTIDGERIGSEADLTHNLPAGAVITSHEDGDEVELDGSNVTIEWAEVTDDFRGGPLDSEIVGYEVVVEFEEEVDGEEVTRVLKIDVAPDVFSAEIPADFLAPDREYKMEVGAREESGNQTFTELAFCTTE